MKKSRTRIFSDDFSGQSEYERFGRDRIFRTSKDLRAVHFQSLYMTDGLCSILERRNPRVGEGVVKLSKAW